MNRLPRIALLLAFVLPFFLSLLTAPDLSAEDIQAQRAETDQHPPGKRPR